MSRNANKCSLYFQWAWYDLVLLYPSPHPVYWQIKDINSRQVGEEPVKIRFQKLLECSVETRFRNQQPSSPWRMSWVLGIFVLLKVLGRASSPLKQSSIRQQLFPCSPDPHRNLNGDPPVVITTWKKQTGEVTTGLTRSDCIMKQFNTPFLWTQPCRR